MEQSTFFFLYHWRVLYHCTTDDDTSAVPESSIVHLCQARCLHVTLQDDQNQKVDLCKILQSNAQSPFIFQYLIVPAGPPTVQGSKFSIILCTQLSCLPVSFNPEFCLVFPWLSQLWFLKVTAHLLEECPLIRLCEVSLWVDSGHMSLAKVARN